MKILLLIFKVICQNDNVKFFVRKYSCKSASVVTSVEDAELPVVET